MKRSLLRVLNCSRCGSDFALSVEKESGEEVESGQLVCRSGCQTHRIIRSIPRFVPADNYASTFGFQWNKFRRTQLDSHIGQPISQERFFRESGWGAQELANKLVLDVGCGAGRFTEISLSFGAEVVAVDYSGAVDACWANFGPAAGLHVIQADIYALPLRPEVFDFVYCFGVLQHTPDVRRAFLSLPRLVTAGGQIAVDVYPKTGLELLWPKYWLRPVTKRMDPMRLFALVRALTGPLLGVSDLIGRLPVVGRRMRYLIPVANYRGRFSLTEGQLLELSMLDTFDMLAPTYDHPQDAATLRGWFAETDLARVEVFRDGQLIGRGTMPGLSRRG